MTTLVTGGAGFLGRSLVHALLAEGTSVRVFDQIHPDPAFPSDVEIVQGSVMDADDSARALDGVETMFHLAANPYLWAKDTSIFEHVNHQGTVRILDAARQAGVRRFVHVSSLTVLIGKGMTGTVHTVDEDTRVAGEDMLGPYPLSKWQAEKAALAANSDDFAVTACLPTMPMGPGDVNITAPTQMLLDLLNGKIPAYLDCEQNIVHVADVARGLLLARDKGRPGERYILGGENISMGSMLALLGGLTRLSMPKARVPYGVALLAGHVQDRIASLLTKKMPQAPLTGVRLAGRRVHFDISKARTELGYNPLPAEDALRDAAEWLQAQGLTKRDFQLPDISE